MDSLILGVKGFQTQNIFQTSVKMGDLAVTPGKVTWEATKRKSEGKDLDLDLTQLRGSPKHPSLGTPSPRQSHPKA